MEIKIKIPNKFKNLEKINPIFFQIAFQKFLEENIEKFEEIEKIVSKSKLTQKQALKLGKLINESLAKRYEEILRKSRTK